jgi:hypothetical protein
VDRIMRLHHDQLSSHDIADQLNSWHIPTARGGRWHSSTVARIIARERAKAVACDHAVNNENCEHYT